MDPKKLNWTTIASTLIILAGIGLNAAQMRHVQNASIVRHAETLEKVKAAMDQGRRNEVLIEKKANDRFTRADAIKYGVIPATEPTR